MRPTLILGDEPRIAIPAARSLWRRGIPVVTVGFSGSGGGLHSRAIQQFHHLNAGDAAESPIGVMMKIIDAEQVDWLLPIGDSALQFVAEHYTQLSASIKLACPDAAKILTVLDKELTIDAARRCGIDVPRTHKPSTLSELHTNRSDLRFPLIAKPSSKQFDAGFKLRYYYAWPELEKEFLTDPDFGRKYMLQEYAPGEGVGIEVLMAGGSPRLLFAHRRIKEYPSTGGVSVVAASELLSPELVQSSIALLQDIGWEGPAMVEYRYERASGRATLMEVNGRLWGSLGLSIAAGMDFPFAAWQLAHGQNVTANRYRAGIRARWTTGVVLRVHELFVNPRNDGMPRPSAWREFFSAARLFLPGTRDMLWAWDDPWPAILELLAACKRLCREDAKSLIRHIIPKTTLGRLRTWRSLDNGIRGIYMQRQLHRMVWSRKPRLPKQVGSVLSICHGNIIRSPFAAAQLASAGLRSVSAGLHARPGRAADERAMRIAAEFGVSLAGHEAALLTEAMIEEADVVFVMDRINEARLLFRYPRARKKLLLLGAFAAQRPDGDEIPDPYNEDEQAIRECYETISHCVAQIAGELGLAGLSPVRQTDS